MRFGKGESVSSSGQQALPNKDRTPSHHRNKKANKSSGKKCNKKMKNFTNRKATTNSVSKDQLNKIAGIQLKAMERIQDPIKHRHQQLQRLQNWCMDRISHLSLHQSIEDATALTAEHLELLKSIDQAETLWMNSNNPSDSNREKTN